MEVTNVTLFLFTYER